MRNQKTIKINKNLRWVSRIDNLKVFDLLDRSNFVVGSVKFTKNGYTFSKDKFVQHHFTEFNEMVMQLIKQM